MERFSYRDWVIWPEDDIRDYARSLASEHKLSEDQAEYLERKMAEQAGFYPVQKFNRRDIKVLRSLNGITRETLGRGLTKQYFYSYENAGRRLKRMRAKSLTRRHTRPLQSLSTDVNFVYSRALWEADWYKIGYDDWIKTPGNDEPFEGLVWYARNLMQTYYNALDHAGKEDFNSALFHTFELGRLITQLEIRLQHGSTFDQAESLREARREGAKIGAAARRIASDEERIEAVKAMRAESQIRSAKRACQLLAKKRSDLGSAETLYKAWKHRDRTKLGQS